MRKTILAIITGIAIGLMVGCGAGSVAFTEDKELVYEEVLDGFLYYIQDKKTGVYYIVVERDSSYGGISVCPRYNADGTLYTGK